MADESKDIKKLIKLQKQRPAFSRMISWEISQAAEHQPVKKGKRKKKKVIINHEMNFYAIFVKGSLTSMAISF
jgi:hypothetical protein